MATTSNRLRVGLLLEQLVRSAQHGQLGLQGGDPLASGAQVGRLGRGDTGAEPTIDLVLVAPVVDRLRRDAEIGGHCSDGTAGLDKVEDLATELGGIAAGHKDLLVKEARDPTTDRRANPRADQA